MNGPLSTRDLAAIAALSEFEQLARQRMPPSAFDYAAGGSWDETGLDESVQAWRRFRFRPRVLTGAQQVDLAGRFLGQR